MVSTTSIVQFFKSKVPTFMKSFGYKSKLENGEKALINGFIDHVADDIVYASIVAKYNTVVITKKELVATLVENEIDKKFIKKHFDTLLKIEALNFKGTPNCPARRFVNDCVDLMSRWFKESKGEGHPFYKVVRHNYYSKFDKCWVIDCWRTDEDGEAVVPLKIYLDGSLKIRDETAFGFAICDFKTIQAIEATLKRIELDKKGK